MISFQVENVIMFVGQSLVATMLSYDDGIAIIPTYLPTPLFGYDNMYNSYF